MQICCLLVELALSFISYSFITFFTITIVQKECWWEPFLGHINAKTKELPGAGALPLDPTRALKWAPGPHAIMTLRLLCSLCSIGFTLCQNFSKIAKLAQDQNPLKGTLQTAVVNGNLTSPFCALFLLSVKLQALSSSQPSGLCDDC